MSIVLRSFSKINLGLAIGPTRSDGFHQLATLYQTIDAHDRVRVEAVPADATHIALTSSDERVPTDARNTAWKIAALALKEWNISAKVHIHIEKRLPVQGGLGAGSANAVAALIGLERELAAHGIPPLPGAKKRDIAAGVGSDVPLFLVGGSVLGMGRGEIVSPLTDFPVMECVLALPEIGVSTPEAFRNWDRLHPGSTAATAADNPSLTTSSGSSKLDTLSQTLTVTLGESHSSGVFSLEEDLAGDTGSPSSIFDGGKNPLSALVRTGIENDFEEVVFPKYPFLGEIRRVLAYSLHPEHAAHYAALSGSGSALFGLYETSEAAEAAEVRLAELGVRSLRAKTLPRDRYWRTMITES
ncbi:4-(cytidine 5'-diphospho)-2-C-methyl-D-erythritol kinase [Paracidobacterium acidisoli]|uniref:4-diphosphocytidyl-2-C-methyl-D-erythritol kinase n=1 Tax=Paracidobacterium acidisoli TaxID=2303751 RepID=A0A372IM03_9BACT|nr:4-(cytidine 5'-diphospho)-2-C-methyl-D-erythritol kinase [Paracidobacterium acidisoli]MBT9332520.1 4-(cytidine 5'-diphospho)-2-C-methyl-D-erythritol kinase [Paracidobacterium acidisoli]